MANIENLQPFTKGNAKYYGKKGGIKSGIVRLEKKNIRDQLQTLLNMPISSNNQFKMLKEAGFKEDEINNQLLLTYSLFEKATNGDIRACELILRLLNVEKEISRVEEIRVRIEEDTDE